MVRSKSVVACALLFAATLCACAARPTAAQSDTASSDPTHTQLHDVRNANANARLLALLPRYLLGSTAQLGAANDGSAPHSTPVARSPPAASHKIVAGAVVGGVALATLLLAALALWRRARRAPPPAVAVVGVRARDTLGEAMDLPKIAPLTVDTGTRAPPVYRVLTPLHPAARAGTRTPTPTPVDLVARPRRCSDWSALSPSSPTSRPSTAPGSPSSPRLRTVGSNGSLTFAPSAYQPTLRPKASTASLRSHAPGLPSLQPLIIPPVAATSSTPSTALSAASPETLKRQRSLASMLDMKAGGGSHLDSPSADTLRAETPRAVVRYEADALISGCNEGRPVRYEVEEDAGTWSEEVVRLPPRYSTLQSAPVAGAHANAPPAVTTGL